MTSVRSASLQRRAGWIAVRIVRQARSSSPLGAARALRALQARCSPDKGPRPVWNACRAICRRGKAGPSVSRAALDGLLLAVVLWSAMCVNLVCSRRWSTGPVAFSVRWVSCRGKRLALRVRRVRRGTSSLQLEDLPVLAAGTGPFSQQFRPLGAWIAALGQLTRRRVEPRWFLVLAVLPERLRLLGGARLARSVRRVRSRTKLGQRRVWLASQARSRCRREAVHASYALPEQSLLELGGAAGAVLPVRLEHTALRPGPAIKTNVNLVSLGIFRRAWVRSVLACAFPAPLAALRQRMGALASLAQTGRFVRLDLAGLSSAETRDSSATG